MAKRCPFKSGDDSSILSAPTKVYGPEHERMSALTFNQVTVGSAPTWATKVCCRGVERSVRGGGQIRLKN